MSNPELALLTRVLHDLRHAAIDATADLDETLTASAATLGKALGGTGSWWRVSPDGARMHTGEGTWEELAGPISEVAAAGHTVEMGLADSVDDAPGRGDDPAQDARRPFGRYVPLRLNSRLTAVLGLERPAGSTVFSASERLIHDVVAERMEDLLLSATARPRSSARQPSVIGANGVLIGEALLRETGDVLFRCVFATGAEFVSSTVDAALGWTAEEVAQDPMLVRRCVHPADRHLLNGTVSPVTVRLIRRDGQLVWHLVRLAPMRDDAGTVIGIEGISTDVSELELRAAVLAQQARTDPLTQLGNRQTFQAFAERSLNRLTRHPGLVGVLYLDLDGFKVVNDTLGHATGDVVLVQVAERLTKATRREDVVARLGGDEFAVLLVELNNASEATLSAQRIVDALEAPFLVDGKEARISTGIGIAVTSSASVSPEELVRRADTALYQAKRSGRGRWQLFGGVASMPAVATDPAAAADLSGLLTEGGLRSALVNGDFRVHYLPEIDARTGAVTSVEALARWAHPTLGLLPAAAFIDRAEQYDVIHALGDWVLRDAARQIGEWLTRFGVRLFLRINVSAGQLGRAGFAESVLQIIANAGIAATELGVDISEPTLESVGPELDDNLRRLQSAGVVFTVDDFGTGATTVKALRAYPLAQLKLDRSLIDRIDRDSADTTQEIVSLAVNLAGSLGADVVAEGVERSEQLDRLRALRCHLFQGFLASPPQSAEAITELLEQGRFAFVG